jgi:hypothetical protein
MTSSPSWPHRLISLVIGNIVGVTICFMLLPILYSGKASTFYGLVRPTLGLIPIIGAILLVPGLVLMAIAFRKRFPPWYLAVRCGIVLSLWSISVFLFFLVVGVRSAPLFFLALRKMAPNIVLSGIGAGGAAWLYLTAMRGKPFAKAPS